MYTKLHEERIPAVLEEILLVDVEKVLDEIEPEKDKSSRLTDLDTNKWINEFGEGRGKQVGSSEHIEPVNEKISPICSARPSNILNQHQKVTIQSNQPPNPVDGGDVEILEPGGDVKILEPGTIQSTQLPNHSEDINDIFRIQFIPALESQYSPTVPRYSISFKVPVEGLMKIIKTNIPFMPQYEFIDKRMGILEYRFFKNNMDAFIQHLIGKHFS